MRKWIVNPNKLTVNRSALFVLLFYFLTGTFSKQATAQMSVRANNSIDSTILFREFFKDTLFKDRGWYDAPNGTITTTKYIEGNACFECRLLKGCHGCEGGSPSRHLFAETDEIYVSFWVKYSSGWEGSNKPYHPHEFMILTNENNVWCGPAYTHLTAYIEQNEGEPLLSIQDGENIDESNINVDLTELTEDRAVAGCNGDSDGYGNGECYPVNSIHRNGKSWKAGSIYFQDTLGAYYKNDWHLFAFCY